MRNEPPETKGFPDRQRNVGNDRISLPRLAELYFQSIDAQDPNTIPIAAQISSSEHPAKQLS